MTPDDLPPRIPLPPGCEYLEDILARVRAGGPLCLPDPHCPACRGVVGTGACPACGGEPGYDPAPPPD